MPAARSDDFRSGIVDRSAVSTALYRPGTSPLKDERSWEVCRARMAYRADDSNTRGSQRTVNSVG